MINRDRIVSVTKTDLITLYALILKVGGITLTKVDTEDVEGDFVITNAPTEGSMIASEPVRSFDFGAATAGTLYFVPTYDYIGFKVNGVDVVVSGEVDADANTLYLATLESGAVAVTKVGL